MKKKMLNKARITFWRCEIFFSKDFFDFFFNNSPSKHANEVDVLVVTHFFQKAEDVFINILPECDECTPTH